MRPLEQVPQPFQRAPLHEPAVPQEWPTQQHVPPVPTAGSFANNLGSELSSFRQMLSTPGGAGLFLAGLTKFGVPANIAAGMAQGQSAPEATARTLLPIDLIESSRGWQRAVNGILGYGANQAHAISGMLHGDFNPAQGLSANVGALKEIAQGIAQGFYEKPLNSTLAVLPLLHAPAMPHERLQAIAEHPQQAHAASALALDGPMALQPERLHAYRTWERPKYTRLSLPDEHPAMEAAAQIMASPDPSAAFTAWLVDRGWPAERNASNTTRSRYVRVAPGTVEVRFSDHSPNAALGGKSRSMGSTQWDLPLSNTADSRRRLASVLVALAEPREVQMSGRDILVRMARVYGKNPNPSLLAHDLAAKGIQSIVVGNGASQRSLPVSPETIAAILAEKQ